MTPDKVFGIDLGTTNSVAAVLDEHDRRLLFGLHGPQKKPLCPSATAWLAGEERPLVGVEARARRGLDPQPILSVKRRMGKQLKVELAGRQVTAAHVSSLI